MSDSEASAADAADNIEQREGQGPGNSEANTAPRSVRNTPSRKRKASRPRRHRRKRSRYEPDEKTSSDSSDSSEDSDSSASGDSPQVSSSDDSTTSDSATSDSAESEDDERNGVSQAQPDASAEDYIRFDIEDNANRKLTLPDDMSDYLTKKFSKFIPDKLLNEKIMEKYPMPSTSAVQTPELDNYVPEIFSATGSSYGKAFDSNLHQIQTRIGAVMGPISRIWLDLDDIRAGRSSGENLDPSAWLTVIEKSITLLGQAFSTTTYHRRMNVLYNLTKDLKDAKKLLKTNAEDLSKGEKLFGKRFYKALAKASKIRKKSREISKQLGSKGEKRRSKNRNKPPNKRSHPNDRPFQSAAPSRRGRGGGRISFSRTRGNASRSNRGKPVFSFCQPRSFRNKISPYKSKYNGKGRCTGASKNGVRPKSGTRRCKRSAFGTPKNGLSDRRQTAAFFEQLETADTGQLYPQDSAGARNSIFGHTDTSGISLTQTKSKECHSDRPGGATNAFKTSHQGSSCISRSISEPCLSSPKEGRGTETSNQPEETQSICRISAFQAGRDSGLEIPDKERGLHGEARLERCLFRGINYKIPSQISPFSMEGENLRVSGPSFWPRGGSPILHQTFEASYCLSQKDWCKNHHLLGRYDFAKSKQSVIIAGLDLAEVASRKPWVSHQLEKVGMGSHTGDYLPGFPDRLRKNDHSSSHREDQENHSKMPTSCVQEYFINTFFQKAEKKLTKKAQPPMLFMTLPKLAHAINRKFFQL